MVPELSLKELTAEQIEALQSEDRHKLIVKAIGSDSLPSEALRDKFQAKEASMPKVSINSGGKDLTEEGSKIISSLIGQLGKRAVLKIPGGNEVKAIRSFLLVTPQLGVVTIYHYEGAEKMKLTYGAWEALQEKIAEQKKTEPGMRELELSGKDFGCNPGKENIGLISFVQEPAAVFRSENVNRRPTEEVRDLVRRKFPLRY